MMRSFNAQTDLQSDLDVLDLHDDTEEELVGSDLHQEAIVTVYLSLKLVGRRRGLPWHVSNQLMVLMGRVSGKEWRPSPDVMVHTTAGTEPFTSFNVATHGMPELVVEVASESTWDYDVELKRRIYGRVGVQEYIVFDPTGEFLGAPLRAWHTTKQGFVSWRPDQDARLHSEVLDLWFKPEGLLLRVFDRDGTAVPTFDEQERRLDEQRLRFDEQQMRITELEAKLRALTQPD
jgi:Uma2 family endonuclease